jgi:hypothetical protein
LIDLVEGRIDVVGDAQRQALIELTAAERRLSQLWKAGNEDDEPAPRQTRASAESADREGA